MASCLLEAFNRHSSAKGVPVLHSMIPASSSASRQVATRSVLNPLLWLTLIVWVPALGASVMAPNPFNYIAMVVGVLTVLVNLAMYIYFALRDPDRLQNEEYLLQQQLVARMGDNRSGKEISLATESSSILSVNRSLGESNG